MFRQRIRSVPLIFIDSKTIEIASAGHRTDLESPFGILVASKRWKLTLINAIA